MRKQASILAAILLATGLMVPAQAADDQLSDMAKHTLWFPVQVLGVGSAMVVGTPIACTRRTATRVIEYTGNMADKIGGKEHFPPNLFACILGVPFGTVVGVSEGVYYGGKNAIAHGVEKPFSADSFSLGDLE